MTEAQENELADMITDVAISYANGHATDFRIAAKAAVAFVTDAMHAEATDSGIADGELIANLMEMVRSAGALAPNGKLDMSIDARLADAESDVDRLHKDKMDLWFQVRGYESAGYKLLPTVPTKEMKIAGDNAGFWCGDKWAAMVAVAPSPIDAHMAASQEIQGGEYAAALGKCLNAVNHAITITQARKAVKALLDEAKSAAQTNEDAK